MAHNGEDRQLPLTSITPLLKRLWPSPAKTNVSADEIALAISHIFTNQLSPVQTGALLTALHFTGWDRRSDIIAKCAEVMRSAATPVDTEALRDVIRRRGRREGSYKGGFCDIVGTGGDDHSTFNVSTTASILASSLLLVSKHGNRASTSLSGSADILAYLDPAPRLHLVTSETITKVVEETNYAFLFAPMFHPSMKYVAAVRKELGWRTIFNLLGPLSNPLDAVVEARIVGVARADLGPVFAEALRMGGAKKAMVVCGEEDLDEISCAGRTFCWRLVERPNPDYRGSSTTEDDNAESSDDDAPAPTLVDIQHFVLSPSDFGLPSHPLSEVASGKLPDENAAVLDAILRDTLGDQSPVLDFVLMNTAALFVVAGVCDAEASDMGPPDDGNVIEETGPGQGRWKEGVRRARWAMQSLKALRSWEDFVRVSRSFEKT
ncbi:MAG: anthranilate phosphoribosyltransferase [Piccolia ochrophora]|nr:MAG: anthranilate phosphoribosyltransferase [Piccolia ochrophora]